jgi:hypothetical protein
VGTMKKKQIVFKNKTEIGVSNINLFGGIRKFYFTNKETVFKNGEPNKLIIFGFKGEIVRIFSN